MKTMFDDRKKLDDAITKAVAFHICGLTCKNIIVTSTIMYKYNSIINIGLIFLIAMLYGNFVVVKKGMRVVPKKTMLLLCGIFVFWGISYIFDPRLFTDSTFPYNYVRKAAVFFIAYGMPLMLATSMLNDYTELEKKLYKHVDVLFYVTLISCFISRTSFGVSNAASDGYSMSFGNNVLICFAILVMRYIDRRKKTDVIKMIILVAIIFIFGSRGPLVSVAAFAILILYKISKDRKGFLIGFGIVTMIAVAFVFRNVLLDFLIELFNRYGINSRTLTLLKWGELATHDSGRSEFHGTLINAINKSPLIGIGAFGGEKTVSMSHSFYLDVFANFGYLFGALLLLVIGIQILKLVTRYPNSTQAKLVLIYSFILFPRGFFDDNVWGVEHLWIIIGVLISVSNHLMKNNSRCEQYSLKIFND